MSLLFSLDVQRLTFPLTSSPHPTPPLSARRRQPTRAPAMTFALLPGGEGLAQAAYACMCIDRSVFLGMHNHPRPDFIDIG